MAYTRTLLTILLLAVVLCVQSNATKTRASEISTQHCSADEGCGTLRLLLVGKTGGGKSTVGNLILGEKIFGTSPSMSSETSNCQLERRKRFGQMIEVMDSPGLFDTNGNKTAIAEIVMKSVAGMNPGAHAILYVVRIGRYTEEEWDSYNRLKKYLGENMVDHTIVLFTHGKNLEGKTIEYYLKTAPKNFTQVLKECGHRYVVFDKDEKKKPQVETLLGTVQTLLIENGGQHFRSEQTKKFADKMDETIDQCVKDGTAKRQGPCGATIRDRKQDAECRAQERADTEWRTKQCIVQNINCDCGSAENLAVWFLGTLLTIVLAYNGIYAFLF